MTISSLVRVFGPIIGNGTFSAFPFTFKIFNTSELTVIATDSGVDRAPLALGTDYSVVLNPDQNAAPGGTITYRVASVITNIPVNTVLNGTSNVANLQPINLTNNGGFFPAVINAGLDRLTILVQQIARVVTASIQYPVSDGVLSGILPNKATRLGKIFGWDSVTGLPVVSNLTLAQIEALATAGTNANLLYSSATGGTGDAFTAVAGIAAYVPGQEFRVVMSAGNTVVAPTGNFDGKGAKTIKQLISNGKGPLVGAGAYFTGYVARFLYDGTDLILLNPAQLYGVQANVGVGTDLSGTDTLNIYAQIDAYQPNSAMGAVGASSVPGLSASSSRGTGAVPSNNLTTDLLGGVTMFGYIAGAYTAAVAAVGRAVGATAANLGGQWELWTKKDNGILTKALTIDNAQIVDFVNQPTLSGVPLGTGLKNYVLNGDCMVGQRPVIAITLGSYTYGKVDRFQVAMGGTGLSANWTQLADSNFRSGYCMNLAAANWTSGNHIWRTQLESRDVNYLNGKVFTAGWRVYHNFGSNISFAAVLEKANSLDNFGAATTIFTGNTVVVSTATYTDVTVTGTFGATDCTNGLRLRLDMQTSNTGAAKEFRIGDAFLVEGVTGANRVVPPIQQELARCQRHFEYFSFAIGNFPTLNGFWCMGYAETTTRLQPRWFYKVTKRVAPSVTFSAITDMGLRGSGGASVVCNTGAFSDMNTDSTQGEFNTAGAAVTAGGAGWMTNHTGNLTLTISAEL